MSASERARDLGRATGPTCSPAPSPATHPGVLPVDQGFALASATKAAGRLDHGPADIPALTGLRAFAAAVVVASHLRSLVDQIAPASVAGAVRPLLAGGMLGVDVFFLLSGFVIAHTYANRLAVPAPGALRDYFVARFARIYPLHLATLLLMTVLLAIGAMQGIHVETAVGTRVPHTLFGFVGNLLMLHTLPGIPPWNDPAWSISCELAAYLVFPLFAARLLRIRWGSALVLAAVALGMQLVVMKELSTTAYAIHALYWPRIVGEFTAGALLWVVWRNVLRPGWWADGVVALCVLGAGWVLWRGHSPLLIVPLLAILVPAVACATGPVARVLAHPATQWGGRISYGLYLVHVPVLAAALVWFVPDGVYVDHSIWKALLVIGGIVLTAVTAAALLHHAVEEPARRWLRRSFTTGARDHETKVDTPAS